MSPGREPDIGALERVIAALSQARTGDRELDVRVAIALGSLESDSGKLLRLFVEEGYDWQVISALLDAQVPAYSTSLDAGVPGEAIVGVVYSSKRDLWAAIQRAPDGRDREPAWAATETLARRAAGLAGLLTQARSTAAGAVPPTQKAGAPPESELEPATTDDDEAPEWKILF